MRRILVALTAIVCGITVLSAQGVGKTVERSIQNYFKEYKSDRTTLTNPGLDSKRRDKIVVNTSKKLVTIFCNEAFSGQAFTPEVVDKIYDDIRELLPSKYRNYKIRVEYKKMSIDERIPNVYREDNIDEDRLWGDIEYKGEPWVKNISRPYDVRKGLSGRHIVMRQSHGNVYSVANDMWSWQRPRLFCTVEDLFTPSIVMPFLIPMLENAGALVYTPRERDKQVNCVIVDRDSNTKGSRYLEKNGKNNNWKQYSEGFADKNKIYHDKENPFEMGTSRVVNTVTGNKKETSEAMWSPMIPEDGYYAVYASYRSFDNSVPDALYTVKHSGGETKFHVNQTMGGGTWVYLGTFHFEEGSKGGQCVVLSNSSKHKGVVSADAVRFGGGMGNVARGPGDKTSGFPRHLEATRYSLLTSGFPYEVYSPLQGENDYREDILCFGGAVNYLTGGSVFNPDSAGLKVPFELAFGFHSDAGINKDRMHGSLGIVTTDHNDRVLPTGQSRMMSRDLISSLLNNVQDDLSEHYSMQWPVRGILDRNYGETRVPLIPSVIFESLSHQNYADMVYGHDPDFKFMLARSVYKSILKHLAYVHGRDYVVQPLPVSHFSLTVADNDESVLLKWRPQTDPLEPTAKPKKYVVYTRRGDGGFDDGIVVDKNSASLPIEKGVTYGFKVTALNDGGESFPSEILSMCIHKKEKGRVLVVNGFHRLSAPYAISDSENMGFDMERDPGVPYMHTMEYCGQQLDFNSDNTQSETGWGLSDERYEGMPIAGNTFDYPAIHGKALVANGMSFVSCGSEAVMSGSVDMCDYKVVDLILGTEKQGGKGSYLGYNRPYKTFPKELQEKIRNFCKKGGGLFVSGSHIGSDMTKNKEDRKFIREVLHYDYAGSMQNLSENKVKGSGGASFAFPRKANSECYAVSRPDILLPLEGAFHSFVYTGSLQGAGVAYADDYRVLSTSFPFEAVEGEKKRSDLMKAIMQFLMRK